MSYDIEKRFFDGLVDRELDAAKIVVAHEAGNPNNTGPDSLENELDYMADHTDSAFVSHWVGNGGQIVQTAPTGKVQWGAGYPANQIAYAQVEMARTDDKETFKQDYKAYIWLLRHLAGEGNIPKTLDDSNDTGIKTHLWVTNNLGNTTHTDPYGYFEQFGITKEQFKKDVEKGEASEPSDSETSDNSSSNSGGDGYERLTGNWDGRTLVQGHKGEPVQQAQQMLADHNPPFYPEKGAENHGVDGYYGPKTANAVERYQKYYGLKVDGSAGPEVYGHLTGGGNSSTSSGGSGKQLHLPASADTWAVYKTDVKPVKENSIWALTPSRYGGLTYDILGEPYPDVYTIETSRGKRNIYAGPGTGASVT